MPYNFSFDSITWTEDPIEIAEEAEIRAVEPEIQEVRNAAGQVVLTYSNEVQAQAQATLEEMENIISQRRNRLNPSPDTTYGRRYIVMRELSFFSDDEIESILAGSMDLRNPVLRRYFSTLNGDEVGGCGCGPCRWARREISFAEFLDNHWTEIVGPRYERNNLVSQSTVEPTPAPRLRDNWMNLLDAPRPRRAVRQEPTRLSWQPTREEEQALYRESYNPISGRYISPRYRRYDYYGNQVLPGPESRNNILPPHHPVNSERNGDQWYSPENTRRNAAANYDERNDSFDIDDDDDYLDGDRGSYRQAEDHGIHPWDYKPLSFTMYGEGKVHFGFELEIDGPYETANIVYTRPELYAKWDGSCAGYEIVSQPMTWDYLSNNFEWDWVPALREAGMTAGRNGLHVHVSRSGFDSNAHAFRWLKLWTDADNYAAVRAFCRRQSVEYATPYDDVTPYQKARALDILGRYGTRYVMMNSQNDNTFEFRMPASSLNRIKIKGTLAAMAASVEYTRRKMTSAEVILGGLSWDAFVEWTLEQPEFEAPFRAFLEHLADVAPAADAVYPTRLRRELATQ